MSVEDAWQAIEQADKEKEVDDIKKVRSKAGLDSYISAIYSTILPLHANSSHFTGHPHVREGLSRIDVRRA